MFPGTLQVRLWSMVNIHGCCITLNCQENMYLIIINNGLQKCFALEKTAVGQSHHINSNHHQRREEDVINSPECLHFFVVGLGNTL